jgi:hypothetical protein
VTSPARSVASLASTVLEIVESGGRWRDVEPVLAEADLGPEERVALVVRLLDEPATAYPHPADVVVCAFVDMHSEDFTLPSHPVDVRDVVDLWLDLSKAELDERAKEERRPR